MTRAGLIKSSFLVPQSLARIKLTLRSSAASVPHYIRLRIRSRACDEKHGMFTHLHREKCLVCIIRVLLEEAGETLEVGAWGIEPIEFACSLETRGQRKTRVKGDEIFSSYTTHRC